MLVARQPKCETVDTIGMFRHQFAPRRHFCLTGVERSGARKFVGGFYRGEIDGSGFKVSGLIGHSFHNAGSNLGNLDV